MTNKKAKFHLRASAGFGARRGGVVRLFLFKTPLAALAVVCCLAAWLPQPGLDLEPTGSGQAAYTQAATFQISLCRRSDSCPVRPLPRPFDGTSATRGETDGNSGLGEDLITTWVAVTSRPDKLLASGCTGLTASSRLVADRQRRGIHTAGRDPPIS